MFHNLILPKQLDSSAPSLPTHFPQEISTRFALGDRVQWIPQPSTDWGTIIGLEYEWSESLKSWQPQYCVLLDEDSPSRQWVHCDWAGESDLQFRAAEAARN